jgi:hypothetical protein
MSRHDDRAEDERERRVRRVHRQLPDLQRFILRRLKAFTARASAALRGCEFFDSRYGCKVRVTQKPAFFVFPWLRHI